MLLNKHFHLTYCSNIHPGSNWQITFDSLKENLPKIKLSLVNEDDFGVGLRLSNKASEELAEGKNLEQFKAWLDANGFYVFTMNGFPYGDFHDKPVKDKVHTPDWTTDARLIYTLRLFEQLEKLLPEGMDGGISTSPISYKNWHASSSEVKRVMADAAVNMVQIALALFEIEKRTGKYLHLDVEPEPDGLLENTDEVLQFYQEFLVPQAIKAFEKKGISAEEAEQLLKKHITLCYDVCHFSLAFEEPVETFARLKDAGIRVGKIQISAALKILWNEEDTSAVWRSLETFNEPTYLHQVTEQKDGKVKTYADLPNILVNKNPFKELRAHFHVPIFLKQFGMLYSTQDQILKTFEFLQSNPDLTKHLEVETYTWDVLPKELKIPLVDSIVRELQWVSSQLS